MRSHQEMLEMILDTAALDERIRAVTMEGSNAAGGAVHDKYSDFDITFFVKDIREFTADKDYMKRFGDILIMQCPVDWYSHPYDYNSRTPFTYLTQYKDGNRIDLTIVDVSDIAGQAEFDQPREVLLNKDNFKELVDITDESCFFVKKPSENEYRDTCNEFRWLSIYATKGLCRDEFCYARSMMEENLMNLLIKMLGWKAAAENDFQISVGSHSKYLKRYMTDSEMVRFRALFANGEYDDMWNKLFNTYDYFAELAKFIADRLSFGFEEEETENVRAFMKERLEGLKEEKAAGKQVMLLGDSLRMGYQPVVSRLLRGRANVSGPAENGRWAGYTLNSLRFWIDSMPTPDVIHYNCGLWDLGDDYHLGRPFSLPDEYESALERTIAVLNKLFPKAKLIMATIMPTADPNSGDIEAYNEIIKRTAKRHGIPVNDLYALLKENLGEIGPDRIHLTGKGFDIIGGRVADIISEYLK